MREYDKNKETWYLKYWGVNNLYEWAMPQKLNLGSFEWFEEIVKFNEVLTKNFNEDSDIWHFPNFDVQYLKELRELHNDLLFLQKRIKIGKIGKL